MLLAIENIDKSFGDLKLFENLSLNIESGRIYSLMGDNGSGKTTLFNILTGFVKADRGKIFLNNVRIDTKSPVEITRLGVVRTFQDLRLINGLSVTENVLMVLEKKMFHKATIEEYQAIDSILNKVSLKNQAGHLGSELSYGQQKLLTLGCCLANNPKLLLLDEPIAGIDKNNKEKIKEIVIKFRNEGISILQIEHDLEYIKATSDFVFHLGNGTLKRIELD